jgi:solute carrier family 25 oxoglutarate transporter 11
MAQKDVPDTVKFLTGGLGGIMAWIIVHPSNTLATRMNLLQSKPGEVRLGTLSFGRQIVASEGSSGLLFPDRISCSRLGVLALYKGLSAGIVRQVFYATSRIGLYEVFRNISAKFRDVDLASRLFCGTVSGYALPFCFDL